MPSREYYRPGVHRPADFVDPDPAPRFAQRPIRTGFTQETWEEKLHPKAHRPAVVADGNPRLAPLADPVARRARTVGFGRKIDLEMMTRSLIIFSRLHELGLKLSSRQTTWVISPSHPRDGRLGFVELGFGLLEACGRLVTACSPVFELLDLRRVRRRRLEGCGTGLFGPRDERAGQRENKHARREQAQG